MMTYKREGDRVTLEMTRDDWDSLLQGLGYAAGAALAREERWLFWRWIKLVNALNAGNPNFTPYEVPEEFQCNPAEV